MILADKIVKLRKRNGWSQEELANKIDVSRQAVSKWESASAIPSLEKILQLSELFGVTSDYLLKDEIEDEEFVDKTNDLEIKRISIEEANHYIEQRKLASWRIAVATFLCIISPITLFILGAATTIQNVVINDTLAVIIGFIVLFALILCAIPIYIYCGFKNAPYAFLDKSVPFELEYGVRGILREKIKAYRNRYIISNIIASCLCVFSPLPLILVVFTENELILTIMLAVTMLVAGIGVFIFLVVGIQNASMQKLLKEGDYTLEEKRKTTIKEPIGFVYWVIVIAIYLAWSFLTNNWHITWLVFAIGGVIFPALMAICNIFINKNNKDK